MARTGIAFLSNFVNKAKGRINEARVSDKKSSQQHTQTGPQKYTQKFQID